jgi:hypothetical protein
MKFDAKNEIADIKEYITERVANYSNAQKVKMIEFGFQFDQGGIFCVFFDTRKDAAPDGTWTMKLDGNCLERTHWPEVCESYEEDEFAEMLGNLIRNTVLELRDCGLFNSLNKYKNCEIGIEEMNGFYGWPNYEDRGKENLA